MTKAMIPALAVKMSAGRSPITPRYLPRALRSQFPGLFYIFFIKVSSPAANKLIIFYLYFFLAVFPHPLCMTLSASPPDHFHPTINHGIARVRNQKNRLLKVYLLREATVSSEDFYCGCH